MDGQPKGGRSARGRAAAMAVCSVVAAVVGGTLLAAPAHADALTTNGCAWMSPLADAATTGTPLVGLTDVPAGHPAIGVLGCAVSLGSPTASSTSSTVSDEQLRSGDVTSIDPAAADTTGTVDTISTSAASATSSTLADLSIMRSSSAVYPVKDGYLDSVRFAIRAVDAAGDAVAVDGSVVLSKAGTVLRTWDLAGSAAVIDWNGRIGGRIETGLYSVTVSAASADGTTRTTSAMVRVLSKHLAHRVMVVRSNVGARSVAASLPRALLKAYATGEAVTVRVRTDADVHGPAKLTFTQNGVSRSVVLRNGVHTTKALPVPAGFDHVTITHDWAKGVARLHSLKAIWSYSALV